MTYSLFLGTGPMGQVEVFSALCKTAVDKGASLDEAVEQSYGRIKELSLKLQQTQDRNPFPGYGNRREDFDEVFERFHPRSLYDEYARLALPQIDFPLIAVEGEKCAHQDFCRVVDETDLGDKILPVRMKFVSARYMEARANYDIDLQLPDVRTIIDVRGLPSLIAGGHFLSIAAHSDTREYRGIKINGNIPLDVVASLMGDNTQLLFLEEGDLVYDEGRRYARAFNDEEQDSYNVEPPKQSWLRKMLRFSPREVDEKNRKLVFNGLQKFKQWGSHVFQLADEKDRTFDVEIFPKEYLANYDRDQADYGQVLVSVKVSS